MPDKYVCTLSEDVQRYALKTLKENGDVRVKDIEKIQEWIANNPHLHAKDDDLSVLKFLRGCKFNIERTKNKMINFYKMKSKVPEWFSNYDPTSSDISQILDLGIYLPLPLKDAEHRTVLIVRSAVHNPKIIPQDLVFKLGMMVVDLLLHEDELLSIYGVSMIIDLKGITFHHALNMTPSIIKKAVVAWQDCYPIRTRTIELVNAPKHVNAILNIFRSFMNDKLKQRIHVHGSNMKALHAVVPSNILPEEYEGTAGKISDIQDYWKKHLIENREWFMEQEKHKADV